MVWQCRDKGDLHGADSDGDVISICRRFKTQQASFKPAFLQASSVHSGHVLMHASEGFAASLAQCDAIDLVYI
ncbi:hypothetical protein ACNKHL_20830 [Shigella flexneri]